MTERPGERIMGTQEDIAAVAGQLAELTRAVEELTRQISAVRERSDVQEERADLQQGRIDVAATELHEVIGRLENAANALRFVQMSDDSEPDAPA
jgi:chromosome segregation ATPase